MFAEVDPVGGLSAPRIWIDDSHPIFRRGIAACLHAEGFDVVGESTAFSPRPATDLIDVLLFDADGEGLRRAVCTIDDPDVRLIALLPQAVESVVCDAVDAGVTAVLLRSELNPRTLTACVRSVITGNSVLPSELLTQLLDRASNGGRHSSGGLNTREVSVLQLLAQGGDTREIADQLAYSERTVKNVVHDLLVKMNCRNRAHAVAQATRQGVI